MEVFCSRDVDVELKVAQEPIKYLLRAFDYFCLEEHFSYRGLTVDFLGWDIYYIYLYYK